MAVLHFPVTQDALDSKGDGNLQVIGILRLHPDLAIYAFYSGVAVLQRGRLPEHRAVRHGQRSDDRPQSQSWSAAQQLSSRRFHKVG